MLFPSLASWLKPSSISCREWATVSIGKTVLSLCLWLFIIYYCYFQVDVLLQLFVSIFWTISYRGTWVLLILPSVSPALFSQSLMWRIGGWVEGQVLPPPHSSVSSYCCPVQWHEHFEIYVNLILLWIQSFGLLQICFTFLFFFLKSQGHLTPSFFFLSEIIFPYTEKYTFPPSIPLPLHLQ